MDFGPIITTTSTKHQLKHGTLDQIVVTEDLAGNGAPQACPVTTPTPTPTPEATPTPEETPTPTPVPVKVTISGRVSKGGPSGGVAGVSVMLSGDVSATTRTDGQGNYAFAGLPEGGTYTVKVSAAGWRFSPSSRTYIKCANDRTANFEAHADKSSATVTELAVGYIELSGDACLGGDCDQIPGPNSVSGTSAEATNFVVNHYLDFLGRGPDTAGLNFWKSELESCGEDAHCREVKRVNVSAAFFLSIESQETGYLVYRAHKAAFGDLPGAPVPVRLDEFLSETQSLGAGVVVHAQGWEKALEENQRAYFEALVAGPRFAQLYPASMNGAEFVEALDRNTGGILSLVERESLSADLEAGSKSRAQVLRAVAENPGLRGREFNRAFVMMEYFGYLRRDPDAAPDGNFDGYSYWLTKLDQFGGDYVRAEMVRAFISSEEYRQRFGL